MCPLNNETFREFLPIIAQFESDLTSLYYPDHCEYRSKEPLSLQTVKFTVESGSFSPERPAISISDLYIVITD